MRVRACACGGASGGGGGVVVGGWGGCKAWPGGSCSGCGRRDCEAGRGGVGGVGGGQLERVREVFRGQEAEMQGEHQRELQSVKAAFADNRQLLRPHHAPPLPPGSDPCPKVSRVAWSRSLG